MTSRKIFNVVHYTIDPIQPWIFRRCIRFLIFDKWGFSFYKSSQFWTCSIPKSFRQRPSWTLQLLCQLFFKLFVCHIFIYLRLYKNYIVLKFSYDSYSQFSRINCRVRVSTACSYVILIRSVPFYELVVHVLGRRLVAEPPHAGDRLRNVGICNRAETRACRAVDRINANLEGHL